MKYTFTIDIELPMTLSDTGRVQLGRHLKDAIGDWFEHNVYRFCYPCEEDDWLDGFGLLDEEVKE